MSLNPSSPSPASGPLLARIGPRWCRHPAWPSRAETQRVDTPPASRAVVAGVLATLGALVLLPLREGAPMAQASGLTGCARSEFQADTPAAWRRGLLP